jgi:hypothetical protein
MIITSTPCNYYLPERSNRMVSNRDQMIRFWVDNTLQLTKDGLKRPILTAYKNRYPTNYMAEIQEKLNKHGQYSIDIFASDDLLLAKLDDPRAWLDLMSRRWDTLFQGKSGSTGKSHVENLREIRDKWAHNRPITLEDAYSAATIAINLLKDFHCDEAVQEVHQIYVELDKMQNTSPAPVILPPPAASPPPQPFEPSELNAIDEDTELITPIHEEAVYFIEVVERDGKAHDCQIIPLTDRIIIGRGSETTQFKINDPRVSRVHLLVAQNGKGLMLTDLRSANGTHLDGRRLKPNEPTHWTAGQIVTIGNTWLILRRGA